MTYYLVQDVDDDTFVVVTETSASEHWSHSIRDALATRMRSYGGHSAQNFVNGYPREYYKLLYSSSNPIQLDDIPELLL